MITAAPGAGKTVLATQIIENMARAGHKCLHLNFEMSKDQLIARSLSRIMGGKYDLSALDILRLYKQPDEVKEAIFRAGLAYKQQIAPNLLYNPDNIGCNLDRIIEEIESRAAQAEAMGQAAPIVCIDYLQLVQGGEREDVIATIKRAVTALKDYAKNHNTIVICISAQSRAANNDTEARQDAGRDTSNIEYSADLQIQMKPNKDDEEIRELYITKSRFAAPSLQKHLDFTFNGKQGRFIPTIDEWQGEAKQRRAGRKL